MIAGKIFPLLLDFISLEFADTLQCFGKFIVRAASRLRHDSSHGFTPPARSLRCSPPALRVRLRRRPPALIVQETRPNACSRRSASRTVRPSGRTSGGARSAVCSAPSCGIGRPCIAPSRLLGELRPVNIGLQTENMESEGGCGSGAGAPKLLSLPQSLHTGHSGSPETYRQNLIQNETCLTKPRHERAEAYHHPNHLRSTCLLDLKWEASQASPITASLGRFYNDDEQA